MKFPQDKLLIQAVLLCVWLWQVRAALPLAGPGSRAGSQRSLPRDDYDNLPLDICISTLEEIIAPGSNWHCSAAGPHYCLLIRTGGT
jgi:hypothetical protein